MRTSKFTDAQIAMALQTRETWWRLQPPIPRLDKRASTYHRHLLALLPARKGSTMALTSGCPEGSMAAKDVSTRRNSTPLSSIRRTRQERKSGHADALEPAMKLLSRFSIFGTTGLFRSTLNASRARHD